ncbi:MAG TPA: extracellular solute-binding protein [Candidatus Caccousia stercoris]|uniref:Extracellular solute-binding protein n=1 Tax=Candidatus Caccousia stercoris TaxID=2840723 RepID=A0A9D1FRN3_9FIRM|nr:extracellular solute-binding protein [Candidatus Caccousia stercoris]
MKKVLSTILAALLAAGALSACQSAPASSGTESTPESKAEESTAEESKAEGGDAATSDITLTYWSMWNSTEPQAIAIQEAIDAYTAETGIKVEVQWNGRDTQQQTIQAALDSQTAIDLFDEDFQRVSTQYNKNCLNLEDMAAAVGYEDYAVAALSAAVRNWAGELIAIPYQPYTSGVFYNKAAFTAAGIEKEPETWDEFLEVCQKLKDAGYVPLVQDDAYVLYTYGFQLARYIGQDAVKELALNGGWSQSAEAKKAADDIANLVSQGYIDGLDVYPKGENRIGFEEAAMVVNASWVPSEITNNTDCDLEWGMFNYPAVEGGKDPNTVANIGAQAFAIPSYSEHPQEAFDLITKITSGEFDAKMAMASNGIPADTRNEEWPEMLAGVRDAFNVQTAGTARHHHCQHLQFPRCLE